MKQEPYLLKIEFGKCTKNFRHENQPRIVYAERKRVGHVLRRLPAKNGIISRASQSLQGESVPDVWENVTTGPLCPVKRNGADSNESNRAASCLAQLPTLRRVGINFAASAVNLNEGKNKHRDEEESDPRSTNEFRIANYNESHPCHDCSYAVQRRLQPPPSIPFAPEVTHHASLRKSIGKKHPNREQGNECVAAS